MQGIMAYRISSMYNHKRSVIVILLAGFFIEMCVLVVLQVLTYIFPAPIRDPTLGVSLCTHNTFPDWFWTIWLPFLLYELLMFGLTLRVALRYYHTLKLGRRPHSLAYILFRDSMLFPIFAVIVCVINLITWTSLPHSAIQMSVSLAAFGPCILGCRLILNLREAYYLPFEEEAAISSKIEKRSSQRQHSGTVLELHTYSTSAAQA
ncbi:hypothetical protein CVT24_000991 [Panaeolus cyanescens]|uniref:G-protein coupled receptors family 3 profile domain-containing protein n=1 Tax=Panaeolus cyanescens TaxID=181874 RepID=A0A409YCI0_9AGAR|nr:hypothetical protein CVT24_000991 [Panaeolus cyanescens]